MKINKCENISFGQNVPTSSFLKIASDIYDFEAAKTLSQLSDSRFPGHVGYYNKAKIFVSDVTQKNEYLKNVIDDLKAFNSKEDKLTAIEKYVKKLGNEIDVTI
jgi:hypothetical protein